MPIVQINYWAVLLAAILAQVIGALWYSPLLFGKMWQKLMDFYPKEIEVMKKKATRGYVLSFIAALVMAYVLAHFVDYAGATTFIGGFQAGFWAWLGFVATVALGGWLWEGKPFQLYLINAGHYLITLLVMGVVLAVWT